MKTELNFRKVAGSALYHNCLSWGVRISEHAWTSRVVTATFSTLSAAGRFSARWAGFAYKFCAVRRIGQNFVVSVPVAWGN